MFSNFLNLTLENSGCIEMVINLYNKCRLLITKNILIYINIKRRYAINV